VAVVAQEIVEQLIKLVVLVLAALAVFQVITLALQDAVVAVLELLA